MASSENDTQRAAATVMASTSQQLSSSSSSASSSSSTATFPGQHIDYQKLYNQPERPRGLYQIMWSKIQMVFIYLWVLIQTLFLIAGLTVLHFSTFSVLVVYLVNGVVKRKREFLPQY